MTLIVSFIVAHLGAILGVAVAGVGVLFGFVKSKAADTKVAQAGQKVAQAQATVANTQNAEAQANTAAAQAGAQATKERTDAENDVAAMPATSVQQQLRDQWSAEDAGHGTGSAGQDPGR